MELLACLAVVLWAITRYTGSRTAVVADEDTGKGLLVDLTAFALRIEAPPPSGSGIGDGSMLQFAISGIVFLGLVGLNVRFLHQFHAARMWTLD